MYLLSDGCVRPLNPTLASEHKLSIDQKRCEWNVSYIDSALIESLLKPISSLPDRALTLKPQFTG